MDLQQRLPNPHLPGAASTPRAASRAGLDDGFARAYARWARSPLGRRLGTPLAGTLCAVFVVMKVFGLVQRLQARPALASPGAGISFWSLSLYQLLGAAFMLLVVLLIGIRKPARQLVGSLGGGIVALAGSFLPFALALDADKAISGALAPLASLLLIAGMGFAIWSLATLGRCFSVMPEVRGLVTGGPYARVRHPLYLGEMVATLGILLPVLSARNVAIFVAFCLLQLWRTRYEEATLAAAYPEYADYRRRTARILPGIF